MTGPLLPRNSPTGLASFVTGTPTPQRCPSTSDDTADGGINHHCNRVSGHDGVHSDGRGALWVDRDGWLGEMAR